MQEQTLTTTELTPQVFFHRPTLAHAWLVTPENAEAIARWCGGKVRGDCVVFKRKAKSSTPAADDPHHYARANDYYVVQDGRHFVAVEREVFEAKYSPVPD